MALAALLDEIESLYVSLGVTELEDQRLQRELQKTRDRLRARDYQIHSFSDNTHNVLERVRDVYAEVEFYCRFGRAWQALFQAVGLRDNQLVLDLGPGFAPKVELGLCYEGFRGRTVMVNKDGQALAELMKFLKLFAPPFAAELIAADMLQTELPLAEIVTANHLLDDLLLDRYCQAAAIPPAALYEQEGALLTAWGAILTEREKHVNAVVQAVCGLASRLVAPGGYLLLTQYQSYVERILEIPAVSELGQELLQRSAAACCDAGFQDCSAQATKALPQDTPFQAGECVILQLPC